MIKLHAAGISCMDKCAAEAKHTIINISVNSNRLRRDGACVFTAKMLPSLISTGLSKHITTYRQTKIGMDFNI